jgi:hypothetical protein
MPRNELRLDLLARLDPVQVKEYARATGWVREQRINNGRIAVFAHPQSDLDQIIVPLNRTSPDYSQAMGDVVAILAEKEQRSVQEVLNDLLLPPADVLRFNESGPAAASGDVPLDHGISLLVGARKQLLAAACSERRPQRYHPRLSLAEAEQLLQQCRLGQTERGSFTVTVACPLHAVTGTENLFEPMPFTRRVTAFLMRSLHRLSLALDVDELDSLLNPTQEEPVISANLCDGLLDMTPEGEGSVLTVTASWARTLPPPAALPLPEMVRFRRENFGRIEALAAQLRPAPPPRRQTFVAFVDTLDGRPNEEGQREGPVILRLFEPENDSVRARAELNAADHHTAWQAYDRDQAVILQGVLRRMGRTYRIDEVTGFQMLPDLVNAPSADGT